MDIHTTHLDRAIAILGSQQALANALGIRSPSVVEWRSRDMLTGRGVPAGRCRRIEELTNGVVTRYELRPDIFGPAPASSAPEDKEDRHG